MKITTVLIGVAAILILGGGGAWWYLRQQALANAPAALLPTVSQPTPSDTTGTTTPPASSGPGVSISLPKTFIVAYTSVGGFSPTTTIISRGDTVTFTDGSGSTTAMWVASGDHPTHKLYDGTSLAEHCGANATTTSFDQCQAGASYSFSFSKPGTFSFHNHLSPAKKGTIVVQ